MTAKCRCQHCGTDLEFEQENTTPGQTVPCPSCNKLVCLTTQTTKTTSLPQRVLPIPEKSRIFKQTDSTSQTPSKLWRCNACHELMSRNAYACPHCGDPIKSPIPALFYIVAILYLILGGLLLLTCGGGILSYLSRFQ
jgi:DNA-directed RNA polymerase subunit RPC12/RpoP